MSKVRNASQNAQANQVQSLLSSTNISAGAAAAFSDVFSSTEMNDAAMQSKSGNDSSGDQESYETKEVESSSQEEGVDLSSKTKEVKLSDEEKKEVEEIESKEISVLELAKQLNVAMNTLVNQNHPGDRGQDIRNVKIIMSDEKKKTTTTLSAENISRDLLRKIDVSTLSNQLDKVMGESIQKDILPPNEDSFAESFVVDGIAEEALQQALQDSLKNSSDSELPEFMLNNLTNDQNYEAPKSLDLSQSGLNVEAGLLSNPEGTGNLSTTTETPLKMTVSAPNSTQRTATSLRGVPYATQAKGFESRVQESVENVMKDMLIKKEDGVTKIQLSPESLGKIEIILEMDEKNVRAEITTENAETHEMVMRHLPQIRALIQSENLNLEHFSSRQDTSKFYDMNSQNDSSHPKNKNHLLEDSFGEEAQMLSQNLKKSVRSEVSDSIVNVRV